MLVQTLNLQCSFHVIKMAINQYFHVNNRPYNNFNVTRFACKEHVAARYLPSGVVRDHMSTSSVVEISQNNQN